MRLTEEDTEYTIFAVKHVYDAHLVIQFNCTNTISEQVRGGHDGVRLRAGGAQLPSMSWVPPSCILVTHISCNSYHCLYFHMFVFPPKVLEQVTVATDLAEAVRRVIMQGLGFLNDLHLDVEVVITKLDLTSILFRSRHLCFPQEEFEEESVLPLDVMPLNAVGQTFTVLRRPEGSVSLGKLVNILRFKLKEIDPSTGRWISGWLFGGKLDSWLVGCCSWGIFEAKWVFQRGAVELEGAG